MIIISKELFFNKKKCLPRVWQVVIIIKHQCYHHHHYHQTNVLFGQSWRTDRSIDRSILTKFNHTATTTTEKNNTWVATQKRYIFCKKDNKVFKKMKWNYSLLIFIIIFVCCFEQNRQRHQGTKKMITLPSMMKTTLFVRWLFAWFCFLFFFHFILLFSSASRFNLNTTHTHWSY